MQFEFILDSLRSKLDQSAVRYRISQAWLTIESKILLILKLFYIYLAFVGIFAFSLFIAQEATQIVIWSNFNGLSEKRYNLVKDNLDFLEDINHTGKLINKYFMWINPVQRWGYDAFHRGTQQYITTIQASVLAHEPDLYMGQYVSFAFKPVAYHRANNKYIARAGKVSVVLNQEPDLKSNKYLRITGIIRPDPKKPGHVLIRPD